MGERGRTSPPQISRSSANEAFPESAELSALQPAPLGCSTASCGRLTELGSNGSPWSGAKPGGLQNMWLIKSALQLWQGLAQSAGAAKTFTSSRGLGKGPSCKVQGQTWRQSSTVASKVPQVLLCHSLLCSTFTSPW